jgi:hypothetical protein
MEDLTILDENGKALHIDVVMWRFIAFKNIEDYNNAKPYFEKMFKNHAKLKVFSANHSKKEKVLHPEYVSTYHRC